MACRLPLTAIYLSFSSFQRINLGSNTSLTAFVILAISKQHASGTVAEGLPVVAIRPCRVGKLGVAHSQLSSPHISAAGRSRFRLTFISRILVVTYLIK